MIPIKIPNELTQGILTTMRTFKIPVTWSMSGDVMVEANNLQEAVAKATNNILPNDGEYIGDSFLVDLDALADETNED